MSIDSSSVPSALKSLCVPLAKITRRVTHGVLAFTMGLLCSIGTVHADNRDEVVFFFNDALGSAVAAISEDGDLCWSEFYTPYGDKTVNDDLVNPVGCGIVGEERGYTGHTEDVNSDLVYMQQRYYDPSIGRFLSIDPIDANPNDPGTYNRYAYANNNPYKYVDPDGRATVSVGVDLKIGIGPFSGGVSFGPAVSFPEPFTPGGMNDKFDIGAVGSFSGAPSDEPGLGSFGLGAKVALFGSVDAGDIQGQRGVGATLGGQLGISPPVTGLGLGFDIHFGRVHPDQALGFSGIAGSIGAGTEVHSNITVTGSVSLRGTLSSMWSGVKSIFSSNDSHGSNEVEKE